MEVYQLYETDVWGSHASRTNLGVFSSVRNALYSLVKNPQTEEADTDRLISLFKKNSRLFIDKITVDEVESEEQVFDSSNDKYLDELKRIIFFESVEQFRNDLGFLTTDEDEITFDINEIQEVEDVYDSLIEEYLSEENAVKFIKNYFEG
jgi:hypothetical protein